jgi:hypothetical protein
VFKFCVGVRHGASADDREPHTCNREKSASHKGGFTCRVQS